MQRWKLVYTFKDNTCLISGSIIAYGNKLKDFSKLEIKDITLKPLTIKIKRLMDNKTACRKRSAGGFVLAMSKKNLPYNLMNYSSILITL